MDPFRGADVGPPFTANSLHPARIKQELTLLVLDTANGFAIAHKDGIHIATTMEEAVRLVIAQLVEGKLK
jgi:hypothetical protein